VGGGGGSGGRIEDVHIALGSVAPVPIRLANVERIVMGKSVEPDLVRLARKTVTAEIQPIDDIRSTARYRAAVAGNLVAEFLQQLGGSGKTA
jgi:putative cofactor-binding repeat protein